MSGQHFPASMTAKEAADMLHLASGREALRMAREHKVPSVKVGRRVLFIRDEIIKALIEQSRPAISDEQLRRGLR